MAGRERLKAQIADALNAIDDAQSVIGRQLDADRITPDSLRAIDAIREHAGAMRRPIETIIKEGG